MRRPYTNRPSRATKATVSNLRHPIRPLKCVGRLAHRTAVLVALLLVPDIVSPDTGPVPAFGQEPTSDGVPLAVTIDDVPWVGARPAAGVEAGTSRLLTALLERGVHATAFVVCDRMASDASIVRAWLDAGMGIGSHSAAHRDLNAGFVPWLADVRRCEDRLAGVTGSHGGFFRFPYLHQGDDRATRDLVADELEAMGYRTAHVTIDNSEWVLASAYGRALSAGDEILMREIGEAYVAHMVEAARHFRSAARRKFGREISHVLLVHANALNADWLGAVLDAYADEGFIFVSLDEALEDPAFDRPDAYVGPRGLSWIYRAEPLSPSDPWDEAAESELRARFAN